MTEWNTELYLKFETERNRAAADLIAHISDIEPRAIIDLGCGPGNSALLLQRRFPESAILGVDRSNNMLIVARLRAPTVEFVLEDLETWRPSSPPDLIYANAALHFAADHRALIVRLMQDLAPGGALAVQMPNNTHEASHALMRMISAEGPWADRLLPIAKTRLPIDPPEEYYRLLEPISASVEIWETTYFHPVDGPERIVEWFEGAELRQFLDPLTPEEREEFLSRYRAELELSYERQPNGQVLLRYPRLFFIARAK